MALPALMDTGASCDAPVQPTIEMLPDARRNKIFAPPLSLPRCQSRRQILLACEEHTLRRGKRKGGIRTEVTSCEAASGKMYGVAFSPLPKRERGPIAYSDLTPVISLRPYSAVLFRLKIAEALTDGRGDAQGCASRAPITGMLPAPVPVSRKEKDEGTA